MVEKGLFSAPFFFVPQIERVNLLETVKIRMNVSIASADWSFVPGDELDVDPALAEAWQECGHAKKGKKDSTELPVGVEYIGFGHFQLSDGQKVKGKNAAIEAQKLVDEKAQAETEQEQSIKEAGQEKQAETETAGDGANEPSTDNGPGSGTADA